MMSSCLSSNSAAQAKVEMYGYMDEVNHLIKDEDWFNIPAPIRDACDGIITMTDRLARRIIANAEKANKKVLECEKDLHKKDMILKQRFDALDKKVEASTKPILDKVKAFEAR